MRRVYHNMDRHSVQVISWLDFILRLFEPHTRDDTDLGAQPQTDCWILICEAKGETTIQDFILIHSSSDLMLREIHHAEMSTSEDLKYGDFFLLSTLPSPLISIPLKQNWCTHVPPLPLSPPRKFIPASILGDLRWVEILAYFTNRRPGGFYPGDLWNWS